MLSKHSFFYTLSIAALDELRSGGRKESAPNMHCGYFSGSLFANELKFLHFD